MIRGRSAFFCQHDGPKEIELSARVQDVNRSSRVIGMLHAVCSKFVPRFFLAAEKDTFIV